MTTVFITGAGGFLGRHFVAHHKALGHSVLAVDNLQASGSALIQGEGIVNAVCDLGYMLEDLQGPFDIAYHFAAPVGGREKIEGDPLFNADSLRLDSLFFRWAVGKVGIAVYPSSSAVYGSQLQDWGGPRLAESMVHPAHEDWMKPDEMYGMTKFVGEYLAFKAEKYGLNTLCIRPFSGYGEGQSLDYPVPSIVARARAHEDPLVVWGTGEQRRDFIHVEDLVAATIARLDRGVRGYQSMNIGSGLGVSFNQIARIAMDLAGYEAPIQNLPGKPSGVDNRVCDPDRMFQYYLPEVSLRDGLRRVMEALP